MLALIALANLVSMTTALADLLDRVERALAWLRVAPLWRQRLALSVALVVRFTPVLILKGQQLQRAWQARSHRRPGWRLMLPFVLGALDDAETVSEALRARTGTL
jgi:biotin transport system permease protein